MKRFVKDPNESEDYQIDWVDFLGNDTISASTWTPDAGITVTATSHTATTATVWVSGGTLGQESTVVNHITTTGNRQADETLVFIMVDK